MEMAYHFDHINCLKTCDKNEKVKKYINFFKLMDIGDYYFSLIPLLEEPNKYLYNIYELFWH